MAQENSTPADPFMAVKEVMKENVDKVVAEKVPEPNRTDVKKAVLEVLENGKKPKDAVGFTPKQIEALYYHAYTLYQNKKYLESYQEFELLAHLDADDYRFLFGWASAAHKLERYDKAAGLYALCARVNPEDPLPWFHSADCALKLHNLFSACIMLDKAASVAGDNPLHSKTKRQALALREVLLQRMEERDQKEAPPPDNNKS